MLQQSRATLKPQTMETYKGFLIECNLRCYSDYQGKMIPMFVNTEFKTIEQAKKRIDLYYEQWQEQESKRHDVDYGKALTILQADECGHDESTALEDDKFEEMVNDYWEQQNMND